jgi:glycosyltransferase involved in cell wall biosynthesis
MYSFSLTSFLRSSYRALNGLFVLLSIPFISSSLYPKVYYGGSLSGDVGGTLVKVKRLSHYFPNHFFRYNIVYLLSNAPYLPLFALKLLKALRVPIVLNQNGLFYPAWFGLNYQTFNIRQTHAYHLADHVFFQSNFCKAAASHFLGERSGPSSVLHNAVDTQQFTPLSITKPHFFTCLLIGKTPSNLTYRIETALLALHLSAILGLQIRLVIAGPISSLQYIIDIITLLRIQHLVDLTGPYSQDHAPLIYAKAHCLLSLTHQDNCPNTVIEAMACGLPVIYSDSGGVPELVPTKCGIPLSVTRSWITIDTPLPADILSAIMKVQANYESYSTEARSHAVKNFDIKTWLQCHSMLFHSLLKSRHS